MMTKFPATLKSWKLKNDSETPLTLEINANLIKCRLNECRFDVVVRDTARHRAQFNNIFQEFIQIETETSEIVLKLLLHQAVPPDRNEYISHLSLGK